MATDLWLVRHGATPWSPEGRHAGRRDLPLSDEGRDEARAAAAQLAGHDFARVWASPQERARETCELAGFGDRLGVRGELVEWDWGDYEGATDAEIEPRHHGFSLFRDGAPGGERPTDVEQRLAPLLADLADSDGATLIFSHGRTLRSLAVLWLGIPHGTAEFLELDTAAVSRVKGAHGRAKIKLWNASAR